MIDERYELMMLIWRLKGKCVFSRQDSDFQKKLAAHFAEFMKHTTVRYAKYLYWIKGISNNAVFGYAMHLTKKDGEFTLVPNLSLLDRSWKGNSPEKFITKLNRFYKDSNFTEFFESNKEFYETTSREFYETAYKHVDIKWFGKYIDISDMCCILSPSTSVANFGAAVAKPGGKTVYAGMAVNPKVSTWTIVHEYCHSFANDIAKKWYAENAEFKRMCDESVDKKVQPLYASGLIMGFEYVTRAYEKLYWQEHGDDIEPMFAAEIKQGFKYIKNIYSMIETYNDKEQFSTAKASTV